MKKSYVCIFSCLSIIILCSLSYQPVIVAQANNIVYYNKSKSLSNIEYNFKHLSDWFPGWFFWNLQRFFNLIWMIILILLSPIIRPFYYLLLWILYIIFPH